MPVWESGDSSSSLKSAARSIWFSWNLFHSKSIFPRVSMIWVAWNCCFLMSLEQKHLTALSMFLFLKVKILQANYFIYWSKTAIYFSAQVKKKQNNKSKTKQNHHQLCWTYQGNTIDLHFPAMQFGKINKPPWASVSPTVKWKCQDFIGASGKIGRAVSKALVQNRSWSVSSLPFHWREGQGGRGSKPGWGSKPGGLASCREVPPSSHQPASLDRVCPVWNFIDLGIWWDRESLLFVTFTSKQNTRLSPEEGAQWGIRGKSSGSRRNNSPPPSKPPPLLTLHLQFLLLAPHGPTSLMKVSTSVALSFKLISNNHT